VIALGNTPMVDLAGSDMLAALHEEMARRGVRVELAQAHGAVRDALAAAGVAARFGALRPELGIEGVIDAESPG
jgi:MFS superfamily sulfate permease-like transporter